ncbi:MAG: DUF445 domain-containing protein [Terrimicrobiaceae bacterium]
MKQYTLPQMRMVATGALVFCIVGMVVCRIYEPVLPLLIWPRAFFEAGTVGALADWFAVVALFRHPMGIPIPHTAILPNNKDRVAESLAHFLETSFLTEKQLGPKFRGIDYAGFASRWLSEHAAMLATKAAGFAPNIVNGFSDQEMTALLGDRARELIRKADVSPMVGEGLEVVVQNGRDREIFVSVLKSARQLIDDHRATIQSKISKEIPISGEMLKGMPFGKDLVGPLLDHVRDSIASSVAGKTIEKVQAALDEAGTEADNPLWHSFDERLRKLIANLKSSPEMAARIRTMQESLAGSSVVDDFASKTWQEVKDFILRDCAAEDSSVRQKIEEAILSASRQLKENASARSEINAFLGEQVLASLLAAKHHARELVISTIQAWDAKEMADKLEGTVGSDLQFIRLNGTIVGGAVGLAIHGAFHLIGK